MLNFTKQPDSEGTPLFSGEKLIIENIEVVNTPFGTLALTTHIYSNFRGEPQVVSQNLALDNRLIGTGYKDRSETAAAAEAFVAIKLKEAKDFADKAVEENKTEEDASAPVEEVATESTVNDEVSDQSEEAKVAE